MLKRHPSLLGHLRWSRIGGVGAIFCCGFNSVVAAEPQADGVSDSSILLIGAAILVAAITGWLCFFLGQKRSALQLAEAVERGNHFRMLFERSPDCVMLFDYATSTFIGCNEAALRLLNCTREWLIGRKPWELAPPLQADGTPSVERARQIIESRGDSKSLNFEWTHGRGDGTSFPSNISATIVEIAGKEVWFCVVRDITNAKRAEAEARELHVSLERRVAARTEELARTNTQLREVEQLLRNALAAEKELSELKTSFVSMVSHEFRTPLGVIMANSEVLHRYFDRLNHEQRREHLESIIGSVRRMAGMMEDVLLLSRVDGGALRFAPTEINLPVLCARIADEVRSSTAAMAEVKVDFAPDMETVASGDPKLLQHILSNLLSNAIKYSRGHDVSLRVKRAEKNAIFEVIDQGIGIPAGDQERLFQMFHRGKNVGQINGTGLGLVIAQRCCEVHGGAISFESEENRGTVFRVSLPMF